MIDHSLKSLNFVTPLDSVGSSSTETGPSGKPIVRTEEGIITEGSKVNWDKKAILWALPQPLLVAGSVLFVAAMLVNEWGGEYYRVWALLVSVSVTPLLLIAERFWAKKKSWLQARRNARRRVLDGFGGATLGSYHFRPVSDAGF